MERCPKVIGSKDPGKTACRRGRRSYFCRHGRSGDSVYRNVDKEATEALAENEGKLVYDYSLGVGTSTDPSGINAEASIKNGAHIIYKDTNNSTNDFHERQKCSLRGD